MFTQDPPQTPSPEGQLVPHTLPLHSYGEQFVTVASLHKPVPLHVSAVLAWFVPALQFALAPQDVPLAGYTQASRCASVPSQDPLHELPSPAQGLLARAVVDGEQVPAELGRLQASH